MARQRKPPTPEQLAAIAPHKLKPGQSGNPAGRPAGQGNKVFLALRDAIKEGCLSRIDTAFGRLDRIEDDSEYLRAFSGLLSYVLPKLRSIETTDEQGDRKPVTFVLMRAEDYRPDDASHI